MKNKPSPKVFVAMSGGVDSSLTALLLKNQGYDVEGITMDLAKVSFQKEHNCAKEARAVADPLGIKHHVLDLSQDIEECVIADFIHEYTRGRTPNPCVVCNRRVKFGKLLDEVRRLGGNYLATGHYAKILFNDGLNRYEIHKAADTRKDQSYFLHSIDKEVLPFLMFPLGDLTKTQVRALAKKHGLSVADKQDSQDICFLPKGGYKEFIASRADAESLQPGDFVNHEGKIVGQHKGLSHYTIGQRDKLGIALGFPVYVYRIDAQTNTVYVGPKDRLFSSGCILNHINWLVQEKEEISGLNVRIRYNAKDISCRLTHLPNGRIKVEFKEPQSAVTPGQYAVFYKGNLLLGGGIIEEAYSM